MRNASTTTALLLRSTEPPGLCLRDSSPLSKPRGRKQKLLDSGIEAAGAARPPLPEPIMAPQPKARRAPFCVSAHTAPGSALPGSAPPRSLSPPLPPQNPGSHRRSPPSPSARAAAAAPQQRPRRAQPPSAARPQRTRAAPPALTAGARMWLWVWGGARGNAGPCGAGRRLRLRGGLAAAATR